MTTMAIIAFPSKPGVRGSELYHSHTSLWVQLADPKGRQRVPPVVLFLRVVLGGVQRGDVCEEVAWACCSVCVAGGWRCEGRQEAACQRGRCGRGCLTDGSLLMKIPISSYEVKCKELIFSNWCDL